MDIYALDSHCHADLLAGYVESFPSQYVELRCGGISWAYIEEVGSWRNFPAYWSSIRSLCLKLASQGCPFYYMVGIHPRSIPADLKDHTGLPAPVRESLAMHLRDPLCAGLGELGLDAADPMEEKVLRWQLDWAMEHLPVEKRIGIHTPRREKERVTALSLGLLKSYDLLHKRIVIDHVSPVTWAMVDGEGFMTGMTLQYGKTSVSELVEFLAAHPEASTRIMLNSDGNKTLSGPYLDFLRQPGLMELEVRKALLRDNALRFFGFAG